MMTASPQTMLKSATWMLPGPQLLRGLGLRRLPPGGHCATAFKLKPGQQALLETEQEMQSQTLTSRQKRMKRRRMWTS